MRGIGKKIIVLGCPGGGKSTFSGKLRDITGLPLFHLDSIWWKPDRSHISREEFDARLSGIFRNDGWIIDGDYSRTYEARFRACDTVIFLDFSPGECMDGIIRRTGKARPDLPWTEREPDPALIEAVRKYSESNRPVIYSLIGKYPDKNILVFGSREEADGWLNSCAEIVP